MKVLVLGSDGQLGQTFKANKNLSNFNYLFANKGCIDLLKSNAMFKKFDLIKPNIIINCAAYTNVDKSENHKDLAFKINFESVKKISKWCFENNVFLIHFSTDYVFDGNNKKPYTELNDTNPITVYGKSKLAGETILKKSTTKSIIIRTSWVYSRFGNNFVKTMIKLSKVKEILNVVEDQYGSPTNAEDLALATIKIIENKSYIWKHGEVFHYSNEGQCSWYEFAKQIFELLNFNNIKVVPVSSKEFKTKAVRPKYSLLDKSKIKTKFNIKIDKWEKSLEKMLNNPNYL